jgi:hypothetical protein
MIFFSGTNHDCKSYIVDTLSVLDLNLNEIRNAFSKSVKMRTFSKPILGVEEYEVDSSFFGHRVIALKGVGTKRAKELT